MAEDLTEQYKNASNDYKKALEKADEILKVKLTDEEVEGGEFCGIELKKDTIMDFPKDKAESLLYNGMGEVVKEPEEEPSEGISKKLNNMLHQKYSELWGEDYDVEKKQLLKQKFDKEHTNELTEEEAGDLLDELDERINKKDIEEKAEQEAKQQEQEKEIETGKRAGLGSGQKAVLKEKQKKAEEGISVDKARELANNMAMPDMVKNLIQDMDFGELENYVWDPEENRDLPFEDIEPKVDLYEMVHPLWEMLTGWSYNIEDFKFNKNEENNGYECKIKIVREGGPSDPTTISFTKTKKKKNLMNQAKMKRGIEKDQWKEYMQSLAYKRAMRPQMRLWVGKFVNAYKKAKKKQ